MNGGRRPAGRAEPAGVAPRHRHGSADELACRLLEAAPSGSLEPERQARLAAERLLWRLAPVLLPRRVTCSARMQLRLGSGAVVRPDLALLVGAPPWDGVLERAPTVVVDLGGGVGRRAPSWWLAAGAGAVWEVRRRDVLEHRAGGTRRRQRLWVPGTWIAIDASVLQDRAPHGSR